MLANLVVIPDHFFIMGTGYMLISYFFYRKPPTRVKDVSLVSFVVLCAATHGAVGTRGPTWDKSVSPATLWCTPTPSVPYEDQIHVRSDELAKWLCTELCTGIRFMAISSVSGVASPVSTFQDICMILVE